jgi:hypothetical protein
MKYWYGTYNNKEHIFKEDKTTTLCKYKLEGADVYNYEGPGDNEPYNDISDVYLHHMDPGIKDESYTPFCKKCMKALKKIYLNHYRDEFKFKTKNVILKNIDIHQERLNILSDSLNKAIGLEITLARDGMRFK